MLIWYIPDLQDIRRPLGFGANRPNTNGKMTKGR